MRNNLEIKLNSINPREQIKNAEFIVRDCFEIDKRVT